MPEASTRVPSNCTTTFPARSCSRTNIGQSSACPTRICGLSPVALAALALAALLLGGVRLQAAERQNLQVTNYVIDADLDPAAHTLKATARVSVTAVDTVSTAVFQLHGALRVSRVTDQTNAVLTGERGQDATIRIALPRPLNKGQTAVYTFQYDGTLSGTEESPVEDLKVASIGDPITYLLYPARWFPMVGYLTDRFTANIRVTVPAGYRVIASGMTGPAPTGGPGPQHLEFHWDKPGFPGTIIAGKFLEPVSQGGARNIRVYTTEAHKASAADLVDTANKEFGFFTSTFGLPESSTLNIVELPDDTVPAFWAPEIAAMAGGRIADKNNFRLLANTIAHQWWGSEVSPSTLNDAWITNGMSRYGELMYLEDASGATALEAAVRDISAGALAYDTIPLTNAGRLDPFSADFQSMTLEKGGMVFHMLRWELGDDKFKAVLRGLLSQYTDKSVRSSDFQKVAEGVSQQQLTAFFAQWLDGTGAPEFANKYTVYRQGSNKGFRTIGQIGQDLDLFSMPVELRIETDGKTETRRINVVGTDSQYTVDTFGRPRHITVDPDNWLLKNSPDMQVHVNILRGQQLVAQGDFNGALEQYQKALAANPNSSLASYRVGEVMFLQRNYQSSANAYRDGLRGDGEPKWTEVWSHIQLGKIFDVTGQRDRAVQEYRQAVQTNDNTQGALNEARKYLAAPYKREEPTD
ncbi:MAG TPA: M1 family aminopeptidase [Acidisarcina sp.]